MIYQTTKSPTGAEFAPNCPADVYVRMKAAVAAARLAVTLSESLNATIVAPKEGVGDWYRANVNRALNAGILDENSAVDNLAEFNGLRLTSKISQFALSKSGLNIESIYLPLTDDHGKRAAGYLQNQLSGLADFMNSSEAHRSTSPSVRHYVDNSVSFPATDVPLAAYGDHQEAVQVGRLGNGLLFLNASGNNGVVLGKELLVIRDDATNSASN